MHTRTISLCTLLVLIAVFFAPAASFGRSVQAARSRTLYLPMLMQVERPAQRSPTPVELYEQEVVRLTNEHRSAVGCAPLTIVPELTAAARGHSQDMATQDYFSHTSLDGSRPWDRMERAGYTNFTRAAENIAAGYPGAADVVAGWMDSPGHRENILNCEFTEIGVGYASDPSSTYGTYWTQDFGRR